MTIFFGFNLPIWLLSAFINKNNNFCYYVLRKVLWEDEGWVFAICLSIYFSLRKVEACSYKMNSLQHLCCLHIQWKVLEFDESRGIKRVWRSISKLRIHSFFQMGQPPKLEIINKRKQLFDWFSLNQMKKWHLVKSIIQPCYLIAQSSWLHSF